MQKPYCKEEVIACLKESDVGLIDVEPYDASIFSQVHERCKLLVRFGVGFDKVNLKDASQYGSCCARTTGTLSDSVAELALRQILACRRQLGSNRAVVESGVWDKVIGNETTHMVGAVYGMERMMGKDHTPVRKIFNYVMEHFLKDRPILFVLTVCTAPEGESMMHGLFIGEGRNCLTEASSWHRKEILISSSTVSGNAWSISIPVNSRALGSATKLSTARAWRLPTAEN